MKMDFQLHAQLKKDLILLGEFDLSLVFLLPDSDHPWIVLVPRIANIKEFYELSDDEQRVHCREITKISRMFDQYFSPDKINIGMLGNMVPQLHTHIICRFKNDRSWPGSLWGSELASDVEKIKENQKLMKGYLNLC